MLFPNMVSFQKDQLWPQVELSRYAPQCMPGRLYLLFFSFPKSLGAGSLQMHSEIIRVGKDDSRC